MPSQKREAPETRPITAGLIINVSVANFIIYVVYTRSIAPSMSIGLAYKKCNVEASSSAAKEAGASSPAAFSEMRVLVRVTYAMLGGGHAGGGGIPKHSCVALVRLAENFGRSLLRS